MTRDQKIYRLAYWIACLIVAATFLWGYDKLLHPDAFALAVYRFQLLPDALVNPVAVWLPWLEVVVAACLLFAPKLRLAALWIALALLIVFTIGIVVNLLRGAAIGCGCSSVSPDARPMDWMNVARNAALMLLIGVAFMARARARN